MRIVLFGPPGVGKGTQATRLQETYGLVHISTGALMREAIAAGGALGQELKRYIDQGKLVPDELARELAEEAMLAAELDRFILDGYPRSVRQVEWLDAFLGAHRAPLHAVISLDVPVEQIVSRLSQRRVHAVTGENYHLTYNPPPPDLDPELILHRPDDRPEAIRKRLEEYICRTEPVQRLLRKILPERYHVVDGVGAIDEVTARIDAVLKEAAPVANVH